MKKIIKLPFELRRGKMDGQLDDHLYWTPDIFTLFKVRGNKTQRNA